MASTLTGLSPTGVSTTGVSTTGVAPPGIAPSGIAPTRVAHSAGDGSRRRLVLLLVTGWLAQVACRLWFSRGQTAPLAYPDEAAYLIAARWLAGGPAGEFSGGTFYQGGYPLLLVPAYWLSHDPEVVYRMVLGLGAVVGATLFPLGYAVMRRLELPARTSYTVAWAMALLPACVFFGRFALTDAVLPVLLAGWLLALHTALRSGRVTAAGGAGVLASVVYATHTRGAVILAVHLAVLAMMLFRRWTPRRTPWSRPR